MAYQPDLERLLTVGSRYADDHAEYVIERHRLADVVLPTGRVVGCDPMTYSDDAEPFTVTVAPGRYPAWAWVAVLYKGEAEWQRRVAALQLEIREDRPSRWEQALVGDQDVADLGEDQFFGYGVDAGIGTLFDVKAGQLLAEWDWDDLEEVFVPDPYPSTPVPGAVNAVLDETTGANIVSTSSGWGDGAYPTFIGYAASGAVASFVTDFCVVPREADKSM
jgi:hypothetical protein